MADKNCFKYENSEKSLNFVNFVDLIYITQIIRTKLYIIKDVTCLFQVSRFSEEIIADKITTKGIHQIKVEVVPPKILWSPSLIV